MQTMEPDWELTANEILRDLQTRVSSRDLPSLLDLFEDPAVLIGTSGDGRTAETRARYLTNIATQNADLHWDWTEKRLFYQSDHAIGFAAFGELILADAGIESRAPFRLTLFATRTRDTWRIRQFHGSAPQAAAAD